MEIKFFNILKRVFILCVCASFFESSKVFNLVFIKEEMPFHPKKLTIKIINIFIKF